MSTKPNANPNTVELTQAELDSVAGGNPAVVVAGAAAAGIAAIFLSRKPPTRGAANDEGYALAARRPPG
jgi:hypothetical protein